MKIKGTPFAWFNDTAVVNKINKVREKLGLGKGKYKGLDIETAKELEKIDFSTINKWSNLFMSFLNFIQRNHIRY